MRTDSFDHGARTMLVAVRSMIEIASAHSSDVTDFRKRLLAKLRQWELDTGLVTIADDATRSGYLYADIDKQNLSPLTPEPTESVSARAKLAVDLGYEEKP